MAAQQQEAITLDNIRTEASWKVLRKLIEEQKNNETMPAELRELFFTQDGAKVLEYTLSPNCVLRALASSRIVYEGKDLGLEALAGTAAVETPAVEG